MLEDIAILTGGKAIFEDLGIQLENVQLADLGRCKKVKIDKDNTVIIEGAGKKDAIKARINQIQAELTKSTSDYDKEKLQERIAKLSGGVAKINVGAATESEMKEKKMRVEDAMHATRAAAHEGILPGGGVALLRASEGLKPKDLTDDEETGYNIVVRACKSPIVQIVHNAGENGEVVANKVLENKSPTFGYDARKGEYCDMVKEGIIDPTKVVRCALQNAASVATLLLTSDALVADAPKDEKKTGGRRRAWMTCTNTTCWTRGVTICVVFLRSTTVLGCALQSSFRARLCAQPRTVVLRFFFLQPLCSVHNV